MFSEANTNGSMVALWSAISPGLLLSSGFFLHRLGSLDLAVDTASFDFQKNTPMKTKVHFSVVYLVLQFLGIIRNFLN